MLVGGEQVAEIDAAEGRATAGHALRILHRGGDQVVEVEILDIEGLAHMRTACLQKLHHLPLILNPIKLGLDLVRCGGHLAQRERGGENLDQKYVHGEPATVGARHRVVRQPTNEEPRPRFRAGLRMRPWIRVPAAKHRDWRQLWPPSHSNGRGGGVREPVTKPIRARFDRGNKYRG